MSLPILLLLFLGAAHVQAGIRVTYQPQTNVAIVSSPEAFVTAISNPAIETIFVNKCDDPVGLVIPRTLWPATAIHITRNLLIARASGSACRPRIDWQYAAGVIFLESGQTITFLGVETYKMEAGIPWGIKAGLNGPPGRVVFINSWMHNDVSPPAPAVTMFFTTIDRPIGLPGRQQFSLAQLPWCPPDNDCFEFAANMSDVAMQVPVTADGLGGFTLHWTNSMLLADSLVSPACLATKTLQDCVAETLQKKHGVPMTTLTPAPALVVATVDQAADDNPHTRLLTWLLPVVIGSAVLVLLLLVRCCWLVRYSPHELSGLVKMSAPSSSWTDWGLDMAHHGAIWRGGVAAGRSLSLLLTPTPGGIKLGCLLGAGSFGRVYEGVWQGRKVAVKVILHSDADARRTADELEMCSRLSHPHIVTTLFHAQAKLGLASFTRKQVGKAGAGGKADLKHVALNTSLATSSAPLHKPKAMTDDTCDESFLMQSSYSLLQRHSFTATTTTTNPASDAAFNSMMQLLTPPPTVTITLDAADPQHTGTAHLTLPTTAPVTVVPGDISTTAATAPMHTYADTGLVTDAVDASGGVALAAAGGSGGGGGGAVLVSDSSVPGSWTSVLAETELGAIPEVEGEGEDNTGGGHVTLTSLPPHVPTAAAPAATTTQQAQPSPVMGDACVVVTCLTTTNNNSNNNNAHPTKAGPGGQVAGEMSKVAGGAKEGGGAGELPAHVMEMATNVKGNETWICMELCDAGSLAQAVQSGLFQLPEAGGTDVHLLLSLAIQVAEGMAYLHTQNVIHGDLKCENVLLSHGTSGVAPSLLHIPLRIPVTAKVADFGLSRLLDDGRTHVSTRAFGTVSHCPPELLVKGELRPAGDVYAFGIMLYEMGTGLRAYQGMHRGGIVHQVVMQQRRPLLPEQHDLPDQYLALMKACWSQEPLDRPSFPEVIHSIKSMLMGVVPL